MMGNMGLINANDRNPENVMINLMRNKIGALRK